MKIIMAPVNITGQPLILVEGLRKQGVDAHLLQYTHGGSYPFGYRTDRVVDLAGRDRATAQIETLKECLEEDFDIFHFWLRTLFFGGRYEEFTGLDLPFIKSRGKTIVYRFTGHDLRLPSKYIKVNPYNAYRYGFESKFDEEMQKRYIAFLQQYVDQFIVQDPEMQGYFPDATVVPRAMNLEEWPYVGVHPTDCPLVVHAPTDPAFKGTKFVNSAVEELKAEGLQFSFKLISGMQHSEAVSWYKKADIVVDQLHMGWYGILALECMALGKPVMVYIREDLIDKFPNSIPVENANPDNIKDKLRELIKDFDRRSELGKLSRQFVEEVHDVSKVVPQLIDVYDKVLERAPVQPETFADLDYFLAQYQITRGKIQVANLGDNPEAADYEGTSISREELLKLRYRSRKYEEFQEELPKLRYKARRFDELIGGSKLRRLLLRRIPGR